MMNDLAGRHPRELLSPFLDGELGPDERAGVAIHLEQCAACRGLLDDLRILAAGIVAEEPPVPPADLAARIGRRVGALPVEAKVMTIRRTVWRSPLVLGSVAAALAGIIVTVVWLSGRPPAMRREEGVVVAQAPAPPPARDRMAESQMTAAAPPTPEPVAADQDARGADDEAPPVAGKQKKEAAADAPATPGPAPPEPRAAAGREQSVAEPTRVAGYEAGEAMGNASGEPGDLAAREALRVSPDSRDAGAAAGAALSAGRAAPNLPRVVDAPRARSLELLDSDFRAVLSEDGALSFRAGAYECVVPAGSPGEETAPQRGPVNIAGAVEPGLEVREIFALAAAEQSRRAADTGEGSGSAGAPGVAATWESKSAGGPPAMILTIRDENDTPLYREATPADGHADAASPAVPIAARLVRLIREHYLPLMVDRCGPLPPAVRMEDRNAPE